MDNEVRWFNSDHVDEAVKAAWRMVRGPLVGASDGQTFVVPSLTNDLMRQIVVAALTPPPAGDTGEAVAGDFPMGAIENGRVFADRLEQTGLECPAGDLRMCSDWTEFRRCFEWLANWALAHPSDAALRGRGTVMGATWMDEAASWHETQARRFWEIAKDDPRIDADTRMKAAGAAQHHAGSAAALRVKAADERRALTPKDPT